MQWCKTALIYPLCTQNGIIKFLCFAQEKSIKVQMVLNSYKLLNTYSDHMLTKPDIKEQFENEIKSVIEKNNNVVKIYDIIDLYLAKKTN